MATQTGPVIDRPLNRWHIAIILSVVVLAILAVWLGPALIKTDSSLPVGQRVAMAAIEPTPAEEALQKAQGEAVMAEIWAGAPDPATSGGKFIGRAVGNSPMGEIWLPGVRFAFRQASVIVAGKRYNNVSLTYDPPGHSTIIRLPHSVGDKDKITVQVITPKP